MNIVSSPRIVEVEFHRIKTDACKLEFLLFEAGEPMEEVPTSKLIFRNANTVVLALTPSVTDNRLTFLVDQEGKAKLNKEQNQLFLLLDGKTVARGKLIWDVKKSPVGLVEAPAIQLNFTTEGSITGTTILKGPTGLSAYEYAVTKGYSGTEEDFAADQANFAATAAEVKADKEDVEQLKEEVEGLKGDVVELKDQTYYFAYLTGLGSPLWYGVEWDITTAAPELTRIGNLDMHRELPIQNNRFGCALKDDGVINYKLHPNNWAYKSNGEPSLRDGSDGQIGVFQEQYFARFETEGNIRRGKFSPFALPGFTRIPSYFRGAYEATVYRPQNKLSSVANDTPDYRGGNNNADWDSDDRSLLGVPASNISRTDFQAYARNRGTGWEMEPWYIYLLEWHLYLVEYANRNCQLPFTSSLTAEGFRQGGLGSGVTNLSFSLLNSWKNSYPFIPCGYTDEMGVFSGEKPFEMPAGYGSALTTSVPRWRGIENPFGHIWKWLNGINILAQADSYGGKSYAYRSDNPANWSDSSNVDYRLIGEVGRETGFTTDVIFGEGGDLLPSVVGGSSATFWADYLYRSAPASGAYIYGVRVGGSSTIGVNSGLGSLAYSSTPVTPSSSHGTRLCYLPEHPLLIS